MTSSNDRRVRKTRAQLRTALTALLREKEVKDITVRELTERADLNRGTFYCHYKDLFDMLEQVQTEMLEELTGVLNAYTPEQLRQGIRPILLDTFLLVDRNADLFAALLTGARDSAPMVQLNRIIHEKVLGEWWSAIGGSTAGGAYYLDFLVAGALGLVDRWLRTGRKESPKEMAELTEGIILGRLWENTK